MDLTVKIAEIAGYTIACLGLLLILFLAAGALLEQLTDFLRRREGWQHELAARRVGGQLVSSSWWFSEDPDTMNAIAEIGRALSQNGNYDISQVRDAWRSKKAKDEAAPSS